MLRVELCTALSDAGVMHVDVMQGVTLLGKICDTSVHAIRMLLSSM